jgi:hypothetical protein
MRVKNQDIRLVTQYSLGIITLKDYPFIFLKLMMFFPDSFFLILNSWLLTLDSV